MDVFRYVPHESLRVEQEVPVYLRRPGLNQEIILAQLGSDVAKFKESINRKLWIGCDAQLVMFNGKKLRNDKSLAFYGVEEGLTVDLINRIKKPGGKCLFGHGLVVLPGPHFTSRCCGPLLHLHMGFPGDEPIHAYFLPATHANAAWPYMASRCGKGSTLCVTRNDQVVIEQPLERGRHYLLEPVGGWEYDSEYTVFVRNYQSGGLSWQSTLLYVDP